MMKNLVSYAYYETEQSKYNLEFFIRVGVFEDDNTLFVIVINGEDCSVELPNYCVIIKRPNVGYDFGAHSAALDHVHNRNLSFDYYIFINCSVIGPFLPTYYKGKWPEIFTSRINNKVKLVGTTISCVRNPKATGPMVGGYFFATDNVGLKVLQDKKTIFCDHETKDRAILNGEYGV